jgi:hypothetical protein
MGPSSEPTEPITSRSATLRRSTWGITLPSSTLTPNVSDDMWRPLAQGDPLYNYRARLRHKNGSVKHVLIASSVLFDDEGHFLHTRCFTVWAPATVGTTVRSGSSPGPDGELAIVRRKRPFFPGHECLEDRL